MNFYKFLIIFMISNVFSKPFSFNPYNVRYRFLIIEKIIKSKTERIQNWTTLITSKNLVNQTHVEEILYDDIYIALTFIR